MAKMMTAKGYCITYGPCEFHDPIRSGALSTNDGKEVPVFIDRLSSLSPPDGIAHLSCDDKGVIADVRFYSHVHPLVLSIRNDGYRFGCMAVIMGRDKDEVTAGDIRYINITKDGLGDFVEFKEDTDETG